MTTRTSIDPKRTVAELQELRQLTGDEHGAQRVAWTPIWEKARSWYKEKLAELPVEVHQDEAGNLWATLAGESETARLIGGHLDSVPNGGWLDGCLNTLAGLAILRRLCAQGRPPITIRLVDWADEEGARFGRSLLASSAVSNTLDPAMVRNLKDKDGIRLQDALREYNVDIDNALAAGKELQNAAAYLELHIEQGPVLESMDLPLGAVVGCFGVERHSIKFVGQAAHSGSTPMDQRRDALAAAARLELEIREIAKRHGGVCTCGSVRVSPNIPTAVVGECDITLDQRHINAESLAAMLGEAQAASHRFAQEEQVEVSWSHLWRIPPIPFEAALIDLCEEAIVETSGQCHRLPSGPLHDAAE
ncbi:MAG: hydantoinase/carbamoylase family amidase, partial [Caldilineaceae bacterium]